MDRNHDPDLDNFLAHYGVKGMKWGVRRRRDGTVEKTGRRAKGKSDNDEASEDYKTSRERKSKSPSSLSNKELRELNDRLNLEQNYSRLTTSQKNKVEQGHDYVKTAVNMAKTASEIYNLYQSPAGKALRKVLFEK